MTDQELQVLPQGRYTKFGIGHFAAILDDGTAITTDGVGTKADLAWSLKKLDTIGIDAVAMNVNDLLCVGATPKAFVDYISIPDEEYLADVIRGVALGANLAEVDVPGGETAIMPHFDIAGTAVGNVKAPILGDKIRKGDAIIGLPSSGIHANGLTLARQILGDDHRLLEPTRIYTKEIRELLSECFPHALINITGGGIDNISRLRCTFELAPMSNPAPIFEELPKDNKVFNLGMGFVIITPQQSIDTVTSITKGELVGEVISNLSP